MTTVTIEQLVEKAGSQSDFARRIGTSQQLVSYWLSRRKNELPAEFVLAAEREFGISRHDIRPDIYPRDSLNEQAEVRA